VQTQAMDKNRLVAIKLQKIKPKKLTDFKNLLALTFLAVFAGWQG
jgi:hypothetical protein